MYIMWCGLDMIFCARLMSHWFFFFSSRRRHTRSLCDWSSDVCSSDLSAESALPPRPARWIKSRWRKSRSEEHTSELQSHSDLVCRLLLEKKKSEEERMIDEKRYCIEVLTQLQAVRA